MFSLPEKYATNEELKEAIWELQFQGLSQREMVDRSGVPEHVFRLIRADALVSYDPRPDQVRRLKERTSWAD